MPDIDTAWRSGFVGRGAELDALGRAVANARDGSGGFVLFAGDGGFGKTRLLEEFARRSGLPRERILWGRCPEQSGAPALWPWSRALGSFIATLGDEELRSHLGAAAAHVARVVPDVCDRLGLPAPQTATSDDNRFRVFGGIAGFLARAADVAPMLVLFDDLHFADRASLALLDFVVHELRQARVVVVGAYRARELRHEPDTTAWMARASEHIALAGFARTEVEDFIRARAGVSPSAAVVAQLHEATEGHPYFLDELVRLLEPDGQLASATPPEVGSRLSEGLRAAIRHRLAPLPARDRRTLELAAVLGRSFDLGTLQLACGAPPQEILDELSSAIAGGIVEDVPRAPTEFRFTHALIREAIYGDLLPAARAQAHRRVALALEQRSGEAGEGPLAELAHHFYFSAALGDADKAVDYATRAAARALALSARS